MHPLLNIADRAARSAGKIILRTLERLDSAQYKQPHDFIHEVYRQVETSIIDIIHKAYPNHSVLVREKKTIPYPVEYTWIIDPLSNASNFIHGFPHLAISIGIQYKHRLEHGLIYDPIRQETFYASRGQGSRLQQQRLRVGNRIQLAGALLGTGLLAGKKRDGYLSIIHALLAHTHEIRNTGSAALDLAYVAAGRLDGFWEWGLAPWDIAAGTLIVQEAGGLVCDAQGGETYLDTGDIISANPKLCKLLLQTIHRRSMQA